MKHLLRETLHASRDGHNNIVYWGTQVLENADQIHDLLYALESWFKQTTWPRVFTFAIAYVQDTGYSVSFIYDRNLQYNDGIAEITQLTLVLSNWIEAYMSSFHSAAKAYCTYSYTI